MRGGVGRGGAVQLLAGQPRKIIQGIRQMNYARFNERLVSLARLVVTRGRAQKEIAAPKGTQVEIKLALVIDKQRAAPFLLQHRLAVGAFKVEIGELRREIAQMRLRAPQRPAT